MTTQPEQDLRELDAVKLNTWIAFHVMGYERWHPECMHAAEGRTFYDPKSGVCHKWADDCGPICWGFFPITDPAAAMAVLEKCGEAVVIFSPREFARFWTVRDEDTRVVASAETLPTAICRFAMKKADGDIRK